MFTADMWDAERLSRMIMELQPGIIINNRASLPGDFDTPEQKIGIYQSPRPWESCMTLCHSWSPTPDSRLNNFYIGGLNWMVRNFEIDGVYIDDSALDRITQRRARNIIDLHRSEGRMDLHSWNHFNQWAGYANCLNLYMDLLPYFDLEILGSISYG